LSSEKVLVVDDGEENREFIVDYILKPNGFESLTATNGQEGLIAAAKERPDLILLDLQMPKMDGREMLEAMGERGLDIPTVLMTFHGSEEIAIEMYRMGVKDYIKKPYSVQEMLDAINRSLSEVRLRKEKDALMERMIQANRELQQRVNELNILYKIGKTVASSAKLDEILPHIIESAVQVTNAEEGRILLIEGDELHCMAEKRQQHARPENTRYVSKDPAAQHVVGTGKDLIASRDQYGDFEPKPNSAAYVPLILRNNVTGILNVSNHTSGSRVFNRNDLSLLSALSDYAAIAVENARNFDALSDLKEQEKQEIRGAFERFVPPSVVERALSNPDDLSVGGTRQIITVLFADIRGYTAWSEKSSPEKVVEMLNDYLSLAAELVMAWEGTLDKFFGDGLMAIFNAPEAQQHHVHRATDAALALIKAADDLNERKGYGLSYSVGLNVGEAVVGYIGTDRAMNYTAIGDVVNLAKRLQENAAPGQVLVDQSVVQELGGLVNAKKLGELKVRNRKQPSVVYRVDGLDPI
jgi:class 3 adenylate cyclase/FixJ family two-component response regulator